MSDCTHDCSSCGESCAQRESKPEDFLVKLSKGSSVKKVIGVVSGKGGVGKSMVTSLLAAASMREGFKTAILDGDITGPSIPKAFGLSMNLVGNAEGLILPATTTCGIRILAEKYHIPQEDTVAIGDSDNDVAMIEYAHIGIAVANAMEVLKEKADYITKSNDEDGPAIVLKKILEK